MYIDVGVNIGTGVNVSIETGVGLGVGLVRAWARSRRGAALGHLIHPALSRNALSPAGGHLPQGDHEKDHSPGERSPEVRSPSI